ncbi:TraR/DksA family transcriptional regulator [Citrobacter werkmanii]|uniref:TraR/DksA family transcriptional regulator n=1 Tax=Citrobacter werkmanii TaxID=67827 RepID=UPI000B41E69A|nr:TraR/DksA family transcriptional regulator [Citrobacter werkmanii]RNW28945.1 TraR/DksA family transcriptional regulator [Citrobacter werkmanii]
MTPELIDTANELIERNLAETIKAHRLNHSAVSATHCEECGDPLIPERRDAFPGCKKCVSCQEDEEKRNRRM